MSIQLDNARRVFVLEVAGLSTRYYSHVDPTSSNLSSTITTGINYTNVASICGVSAYSAEIDITGGVASYQPVSIQLTSSKIGGSTDPHVIFGRCGGRSTSVTFTQCSTSIEHRDTAPITITVDKDLTALSYPRLMHIGAETVLCSGATSNTLTISERGVNGTPKQSHRVTLEGSNKPEVSTEITTFRGRQCKLYIAQQRADGSTTDYFEIVNGFIESTPTFESGDTVELEIVPLVALVDNNTSDEGNESNLLHGFHHFDRTFGQNFNWIVSNARSFELSLSAINTTTNTVTLTFSSPINSYFDLTLSDGFDGTPRHPRFPLIKTVFQGAVFYPTSYTLSGGLVTHFVYDATKSVVPAIFNLGSPVLAYVVGGAEVKNIVLGNDEIKEWPDVINDQMDAVSGADVVTGVEGRWARFRVNNQQIQVFNNVPAGRIAPVIAFAPNMGDTYNLRTQYEITTVDLYDYTADGDERYNLYLMNAWFGFDGAFPDDDRFPNDSQRGSVRTYRYSGPESSDEASLYYDVRGVARAYYQRHEGQILVTNSLGLPTSAGSQSYSVQIQYFDRKFGLKTQSILITHETTASFGGSTIGYILHVDRTQDKSKIKSFGDWQGEQPAVLKLASKINAESPGVVLLRLLMSGGGDQINGSYDTLQIGLNIDQSNIDIDSFLRYSASGGLPELTLEVNADGSSFRELIDPILKTLGAVMIMRRTETGSKIALRPIGLERSGSSQGTILEGDWIADPPPKWSTSDDIITQLQVQFDYDSDDDKYKSEIVINNQEAINRYGGERSKISLELKGLSTENIGYGAADQYQFFLPLASRIFNQLSDPRRTWIGSIGTGKSIYTDLGSYWSVTSSHLKGLGDDYGVTAEVAMVTNINQELMEEGTELVFSFGGESPRGWNASAQVKSVPAVNQLEVEANIYSTVDELGNTTTDIKFFSVGDVVDHLAVGNQDSATTGLIIDTINTTTNIIQFTTNHGISTTGGSIEPTVYSSASSTHKADAYIDQEMTYQ